MQYAQPTAGYRTGLEPVLLAASVPAETGDLVLEAGTGAGAGLLCLAARVAGVAGLGLERDGELAALAAANFVANSFDRLAVQAGDLLSWQPSARFDHAFANPPWHASAGSTSPHAGRRTAKTAAPGLLATWVAVMATALRPRGTLSLILPAASLAEAMGALVASDIQEIIVFPLWPRAGTPAKLMILQGKKGSRGLSSVLPGLILHADAGFSAEADAVLRLGQALPLARRNRASQD